MADRRQQADRREKTSRRPDRRRKGEQRILVIELTSSDLRVAELQKATGDDLDQLSTAVYPWRREAASLQSPEGQSELTAALREVARRHAVNGAEIRVVLSGEFCIMRVIRGTVEEVRGELQQLEQRSRLYLSLGPGEKVLVSHTRALDARHGHALAAACNRATLDTIQAAAEAVGIEIAVIEPALSALNRAVSRLTDVPTEPYLLVHFNQDAVEVGVCHEGQLLLDYRPGGRTSADELPILLENHLTRLSRHVGRFLRGASPKLSRVFLCGDEQALKDAIKHFRWHSSLQVRCVRPADVKASWQFRDNDISAASAPLLGGLLAAYLPENERDAPNLMRHVLDRKRAPLRPRLIRSVIPIAATMLAALSLAVIGARQQHTLSIMQTELDGLAVVEARANELRLQLLASDAKLAQLKVLSGRLPPRLGGEVIRRLAGCMPSDVWLNRLELTDQASARIQGASYLEAGVYDFVRWLQQAPGFAEVALRGTNVGASTTGPTTNFELVLTLGDPEASVTKVARHE